MRLIVVKEIKMIISDSIERKLKNAFLALFLSNHWYMINSSFMEILYYFEKIW